MQRSKYTLRVKETCRSFLGTTEVESTLDEVRAIFTAPTTADVRRVNAAYFPDVMDEVRLYTLSTPTEDRPHHLSSVSWAVFRSPLQGRIVRYRDYCTIEHLEDVEIDGKKAWIRACKSIVLPACPDLENKPGILRVTELEHLIGAMLMTMMAESQYESMNSMQKNVYAHRLCHVTFLPSSALVRKRSRTKCAVCLKKFGTFSRKTNCRRCGQVVCSKVCSSKYKMMLTNVLVEIRVCSHCIPGPNEVEQTMPRSTPMTKALLEDMSSSSGLSNPTTYYTSSKDPLRRSQSENSGDDGFSDSDYSKIFVDLEACNRSVERDDDAWSDSEASVIYDVEDGGVFDISGS
ncbi:unnamed protein product [Aphanomyces euteiches]